LAKDRVRFVLAPKRLKPEDRHALFHGLEFRNQVLLLEPRDGNFDLDLNADLLHWAKRQIAVDALLGSTEQPELRETYERIKRADRKYCGFYSILRGSVENSPALASWPLQCLRRHVNQGSSREPPLNLQLWMGQAPLCRKYLVSYPAAPAD
jgi:hypothetical protein